MMNHIIRRCFVPALLAACLVSSHLTQVHAAMFMKFDGIDGESQDAAQRGAIDVLSWSWGASNPGSHAGGGGGGAGKVIMTDVTVTKMLDKSSPRLMLACARGEHIREAVLICRDSRDEAVEYLKITFSDILVSSYSVGGGDGDARPTESISFNFSRIEIEYVPVDAKGTPEEPVRASWDLVENTAQ